MTVGAILGILFAIVMIGGGTAVLILRHRVAAWNARVNRDSFGKFGERVAQNSTPGWVTAVGIGLVLVGVVSLLRVLFPGSN